MWKTGYLPKLFTTYIEISYFREFLEIYVSWGGGGVGCVDGGNREVVLRHLCGLSCNQFSKASTVGLTAL